MTAHPTLAEMQAMIDDSPFVASMAMRIEAQEVVVYVPMQKSFERDLEARRGVAARSHRRSTRTAISRAS
jgi:hypothetical protein